MMKHELHTIGLWARQPDPANLQWLEHRAALKAARQAELQRVLAQNRQIRAQEVSETATPMPLKAHACAA